LPSIERLKMFMEYIFDTSVGILSDHSIEQTLNHRWNRFRGAYEWTTNVHIPDEVSVDVLGVRCRSTLRLSVAKLI
jgi:hypothetical protein